MAIDPRRTRRGLAERYAVPSSLLRFAAVVLFGPMVPCLAQAQLIGDGSGSFGDPWRFVPGLQIDETYSDNINLDSRNPRSDLVTTVSPSLVWTRNSRRLTFALDYTPQVLYYARGSDGFQLRNSFSSTLSASLIENLLFFDANANIAQGNISPFGTQAADTVNGSNNRAESRSYSFGPTLRSRLQQDVTYSLGARFAQSSSDSEALATSHSSEFFASAQTSTSFRDLGLGVNVDRARQDYGNANSILTETATTTVTYVLLPTVHLQGTIGYDRNSYPTTGQPDLKGLAYSGGFDWEPSHHTSLNVQFGHRYFGPTANVHLAEATPHLSVTGIYSRDQTTSSAGGFVSTPDPNYQLLDQLFRTTITDPALRAQAVTSALGQAGLSTSQFTTANFLTNQIYLQKRIELAVALLGLRNTVTVDLSRTEQRGLSNLSVGFNVFDQSSRFRSTTYSANWSHRLDAYTSVNVTAQRITSVALEGSGSSNQRVLIASASRQLSRRLSSTVLVRNTKQTGTGDNGGFYSGNYHENAVIGSLHLSF